jgi:hypothetical protein
MLARRLTTILPEMTLPEAIETTRIHSVAGLTGDRTAFVTTRPFRAPHHTISDVGLIGGGQVPLPGEVSLAHNGILFLDELPECRSHVLEGLRQPLENASTRIQSRGCHWSRRFGHISRLDDNCSRHLSGALRSHAEGGEHGQPIRHDAKPLPTGNLPTGVGPSLPSRQAGAA